MSGKIKGITVEIGGDTTKLGTALKGVESQTRSLQSELRGVNSLLKMDPGNVTLLKQKQDLLTESIKKTEEKLNTLKEAEAQVQEQFEKGEITEEQYRDFQREIANTEQKLESLKKEAKAFGDVHSQQIAAAGEKMKEYGGKVTDAGKTMSKVSAGVAAVGAAAVKTTADFDTAMSNVQAISGATGDDFDKLRDKAIEMGSKTKFSASESAEALTYMAMAGWKTNDMLNGIDGIMEAAAATGADLATTSDIITDALTAFGMSASDSSRMADVLAKTSNSANTNIEMLGETFKYAAPVCGTLGISLEDCAVAAGLMGNSGIKASQAGTAIRKGLLNLASPTKSVAEAMQQYNIHLVENEDGSINLMATMQDMRKKLGGLSEAEQTAAISAIAGENAVSGWAAIVNASEDDFNNLSAAIADSNGVAHEASEIQLDNLSGQITILKSTMEGIAIQLGDILMPTIRAIVEKIQEWTSKFSALDEGSKKIIVVIAAIVAAIGPVLLIIGKLMTTVGTIMTWAPKIKTAITAIKGAMTALNSTLLANPVFLIIAAITAVIAILVLLYKNCEPFREFVDNLWAQIKEFFKGLVEWFKSLPEKIDELKQKISDKVDEIKTRISDFVNKIIGWFKDNWQGLLLLILNPIAGAFKLIYDNCDGFREKVNNFTTKVKDIFTTGFEKIKTFFTEKIPALISNIVTWASEIPTKIYNAIKSTIDKVVAWGKSVKDKAVNAITSMITSVIDKAKALPDKIKNAIHSAIDKVKTWANDMKTKAKDGMSNLVTAVIDKLKSLPDKIKSIGGNMIQGLWNGIKDKIGWIRDKISGFKDQVLNQLKSVFGIHSPSRLLKTEIGYRLAEGIGEGVSESDAPGEAIDDVKNKIINGVGSVNGLKLNRQIESTFNDSSTPISDNAGLLGRLDAILTAIESGKVIQLDTGALVGGTINAYDYALSDKKTKLARGW